jgi:hypothetical protein
LTCEHFAFGDPFSQTKQGKEIPKAFQKIGVFRFIMQAIYFH